MNHLLVTGGAGFIGANFVHYWLKKHPHSKVTVLDALTYAGSLSNLECTKDDPHFRFVQADICDTDQVTELLRSEHVDCVVHFAAESHVDRSIAGPDEFVRTNVLGTHSLLKSARAAWATGGRFPNTVRFHHVSTDEVYGSLNCDAPAFTENTPYAPNSPYSATKAASDHLVRSYHHTYGLPVTTTNCSNNYGPYQFPEKLIPLMIVNALEGRPLPVYGEGLNVRDWLYVEDHCRAIELVLERGTVGDTYNVGGRSEIKNIDIVRSLCALLRQKFEQDEHLRTRFPRCPASRGSDVAALITYVADRPGHDWRYAIDSRKIENGLGFRLSESFESGLRRTLDWYLENESWWRTLKSPANT